MNDADKHHQNQRVKNKWKRNSCLYLKKKNKNKKKEEKLFGNLSSHLNEFEQYPRSDYSTTNIYIYSIFDFDSCISEVNRAGPDEKRARNEGTLGCGLSALTLARLTDGKNDLLFFLPTVFQSFSFILLCFV